MLNKDIYFTLRRNHTHFCLELSAIHLAKIGLISFSFARYFLQNGIIRSCAAVNRCFGSFSNIALIMLQQSVVNPDSGFSSGAGPFTIAYIAWKNSLKSAYGNFPVSSSTSVIPRDQTSLGGPYGCSPKRSGAI